MTASRPLPLGPELESLALQLQAQLDLYQALDKAARALGDAVRQRDVAEVTRCVQDQQKLAEMLALVATQARAALGRVAVQMGLPDSVQLDVTLARVSEAGMPERSSVLRAIAAQIRKASEACGRRNAQNAALLRQALAYTNFSLRLLTAAGTTAPSYTGTGAQRPLLRRLVDTHA